MEPRFLKRGNSVTITISRFAYLCFNGTTLSQTWKYRFRALKLKDFAGFNGTTLSQTWKSLEVEVTYEKGLGFNGTTLSQTWKSGAMFTLNGRSLASMEPRFLKRGNRQRQ